MDDVVLRAMQKWPDVPNVYGWLELDRRGQWLVKGSSGRFDVIRNSAIRDFIGRNYACDQKGRWFFQNGPQRVFVGLHVAPWVYRLEDRGEGLMTHTGRPVNDVEDLYLDEHGSLFVKSEPGVGLLLDRDLPAILDRLQAENERLAREEALLELASWPGPASLRLFGKSVAFSAVRSGELPARFGFVLRPAPQPGEPEC